MSRGKYYLKFGGTAFKSKANPREINNFVRKLPLKKRDSMFEVAKELENNGLIETFNLNNTEGSDSCL